MMLTELSEHAHREPQWGSGKHSRWAPLKKCLKKFFFLNGAYWCTWYFWATASPNVAGYGVTYPQLPPLDEPVSEKFLRVFLGPQSTGKNSARNWTDITTWRTNLASTTDQQTTTTISVAISWTWNVTSTPIRLTPSQRAIISAALTRIRRVTMSRPTASCTGQATANATRIVPMF